MRKFILLFLLIVLGAAGASLWIWHNKTSIAAHFLSKELKVPVRTIKKMPLF